MKNMIKTKNLTKTYKAFTAVDHVSLHIKKGSIYGFLGPNGAGKSTTMKMLLGLTAPTDGDFQIDNLTFPNDRVQILKKIGSFIESPSFYPNLTGKENLDIIRRILGLPESSVDEALELVGLSEFGNRLAKKYSLGMKQRLGLASALLGEPPILILDEPTNGLDIEGIIEMRNLIKKLSQQGMAILISSHNLTEIDNLCNRIIAIKDGKIVTNDTIENFKKDVKNNVSYELKLNSLDKIEKFIFDYKFELLKDNIIKVYISKENISNLIKKLIENGYQIYSVQEVKISSEEAFLKKVGDKKDD